MTTPFIFIGTHTIKPGQRQAFQAYFARFCTEIVEPQEPRLHSFYGYAAPDSDVVTIVQVHPDADSMATHMKVGRSTSPRPTRSTSSPKAPCRSTAPSPVTSSRRCRPLHRPKQTKTV